jgi:hypothetical protein
LSVDWTLQDPIKSGIGLMDQGIREIFYEEEVDGRALLLVAYEWLRNEIKINLGLSLIIASAVARLRERVKTFS